MIEQEVMQQLEAVGLGDDVVQEIAPGRYKRVGECTPEELKKLTALISEKAELWRAVTALKLAAAEVSAPRDVRREVQRLERRAHHRQRLRDIRDLHDVLQAVVGSAR